jgi:hypothetical protein
VVARKPFHLPSALGSRRRTRERDVSSCLLMAVATLALMLGLSTRADAGTYVVHSCRLPNGGLAATGGWQARAEGDAIPSNACLSGGSLSIGFRAGTQPNNWYSGPWGEWVFDAPPDTRISAYSVYRFVRVHVGGPPGHASEYRHWVDNRIQPLDLDFCNPAVCRQRGGNPGVPRDDSNLVRAEGVDADQLGFLITCWRSDAAEGCPFWWEPTLQLYASDVSLRDVHAPAIVDVSGDLAGVLNGTRAVGVRALDRGGGVHRALLEVDGINLVEQTFATTSGSCAQPFTDPVPCPLSGESRVPLDTSRIVDGQHQLRVLVTDAAGNEASAGPYSIEVDNAGATCAYGNTAHLRARFRRTRTARLRTRAGRNVEILGRLRGPGGEPVEGAVLRVLVRERNQAVYRQTRMVTTNKQGRFRFSIHAGSSRRLRLSYCAPGGGAVRQLRLAVAASSRISARRRLLRNGQSMVLFGDLVGGRVPRHGKLVEIQAFFRNRWRTISTVRSDRQGRWRFRYRFDGTRGRVIYRFRAFLPEEAGYPYEAGASRQIRVMVTGP